MNPGSGRSYAKNLRTLLSACGCAAAEGVADDIVITDVTLDSRAVRPGGVFIALAGARTHGIGFAAQAAQAGARAILWEPSATVAVPRLPAETALIGIPGLAESLGNIADRFFDTPSADLRVTGITGTNGKTTTAHVLAQALAHLGESSAYAGTLGVGRMALGAFVGERRGADGGEASRARCDERSSTHTTPDCITVHRRLAELRDAGTQFLGMEVSSHALDQHRVAGVRFDTAVFTNLTHDHLDYHGSLEAYGAAKARLFSRSGLKYAVINTDDEFGRSLSARATPAQLVFYGCRGANDPAALATRSDSRPPVAASAAPEVRELHGCRVSATPAGLVIDVDGSWGAHALRCGLIGDFNAENLLAVLGTLLAWGIPPAEAIAALARCVPPPGRMEVLGAAGQVKAIIDYAHTPVALEKALQAARGHCTGTLTCVFGCGGERDMGKRPLMAQVAESLADVVIVTDDNPRGEDGGAIVADIMKGFARPDQVVVERNRAAAIADAIRGGKAGDMVLIAGKGHEDYQIIGTRWRYFSDRAVARAVLGREAGFPGAASGGGAEGAKDAEPGGRRPGREP